MEKKGEERMNDGKREKNYGVMGVILRRCKQCNASISTGYTMRTEIK
jgi:hypothetical protein